MSAVPNIEAVAVIIKVDGRTTLAPIDPAGAQLFVGMIAAFQAGAPKETKLIVLPEHVVQHVEAMSVALREAITSRAPKGGAQHER